MWSDARQWGRDHPRVVDAAVAVVLLALGVLAVRATADALAAMGVPDPPRMTAPGWAAYVVMVGALAFRRVVPLVVVSVVAIAFVVHQFGGGLEGTVSNITLFVAIHAAGAHGRPVARDVVRGLVVVAMMGVLLWSLFHGEPAAGTSVALRRVFTLGLNVFFFGAAWAFGDLSRIRAERERQLASRTRELELERERNAARAVVEERVRIARELHDVLAHHVSVMGVQAGAARHVLHRDPARAAEPLAAIESSARSAVVELQRMLAFLRSDDDERGGDRAPQPGLGQLDRLVDDVRRAGLEVDLRVEGDVHALPDTVHLSAYRIVQESLTNVLKHAGPRTRATVWVHRGADRVEVEVVDDGRGPRDGDGTGTGSGLVGMRERVGLHGGSLEIGPRPDGGFRVRASLPLAAAAPA